MSLSKEGQRAGMAQPKSPIRPSNSTKIKYFLFRNLERIIGGEQTLANIGTTGSMRNAAWVFLSTIGELNAISPFLTELKERLGERRLVLITDHAHYRESYQRRFPEATVVFTRGHGKDARALAEAFPPQVLIVAEIPVSLHDAPCRFSFSFLMEAKRSGAAALVVNGWLYHYKPACRMDSIENRLFRRCYLQLFDEIGVQTREVKSYLIGQGADPERIKVTGNIKFDAMSRSHWASSSAQSPRLIEGLVDSGRPIIVCGCVTSYEEQELVLDAFVEIRSIYPSALLILAPRHPELRDRMVTLRKFLEKRDIAFRFRSTCDDERVSEKTHGLVLDTVGELMEFYAVTTIAHVGVNHNILEPLSFFKPVTIRDGWNKTYPSYSVYCVVAKGREVVEITTRRELANAWLSLLDDSSRIEEVKAGVRRMFRELGGALEKSMVFTLPWLDSDSGDRSNSVRKR